MRKILMVAAMVGILSGCGPKVKDQKEIEVSEVQEPVVEDALPNWVSIITDKDTGCQYLASNNGGLVKREGSACPTKGPMVEESPSN